MSPRPKLLAASKLVCVSRDDIFSLFDGTWPEWESLDVSLTRCIPVYLFKNLGAAAWPLGPLTAPAVQRTSRADTPDGFSCSGRESSCAQHPSTHTCTHTLAHVRTHTRIDTNTRTHTCVHMHSFTHVYTPVCARTRTHTCAWRHVHTCAHARTHTHA